jgi:general stress protein 26
MSRREQIKMSDPEVAAFLQQERVVTCATIGPRGWPHLMPLWFVVREESEGTLPSRLWAWTYASSQKTRNLERDARATLLFENGESYDQLRGVMFECEVTLHRATDVVAAFGRELFARYAAPPDEPPVVELPSEVAAMVEAQAPKRVALEFAERRRASWDHRKLGGVY